MKCLACRRELLVDPRNNTPQLISHIKVCQPCRHEREQLLALEESIESSLDKTVPESLQNRLLEISHAEKTPDRSRRGLFYGHIWQMAAGIMLIIGLAVYFGLNQYSPVSNAYALEETVINHITDELNELHGSHNVSRDSLKTIMENIKTRARGDIGRINYASNCQIRKNAGAHLIVNGENGPVTVLVMPGEHIDKDIHISSGRFDGAIYPTGYGSLAVVGEKGELVRPIAEKLLHNIVAESK